MALTPLITGADLQARYPDLIERAGIVSSVVLDDIADGALEWVEKELGYRLNIDSVTGLPQVKETLDGGRPTVVLKAPIDTEVDGYTLQVKELGVTLTPRLSWPAPGTSSTGDYIIHESTYALIRLAGPGARVTGIWGAFSSNSVGFGFFGSDTLGGPRKGGDYTDNYRGAVEVTYTPDIKLKLIKQVALDLCRLTLLETKPDSSISDGEQSVSVEYPADMDGMRQAILDRLPRPILIGTGN